MTGTMTAVKQGAVWFHEFMVIQAEDDGWVLRLKHFEPGLVSWEEKQEVVIFPLQSTTDGVAEFDGLRFERPAPDTLRVVVVQENPVIYRTRSDSHDQLATRSNAQLSGVCVSRRRLVR